MKANVLYGIGDLRYTDVDVPTLKSGEVLVEIKAAGICGSDISRVFCTGTYHFPTIIGHEFAGKVVDAFCEKDKQLIGRRVSVFPLIPCMKCENCAKGNYETCSHYNYLGSRCDGGFAEYVAVPMWNLNFLPDNVTYEEAAMNEPAAVGLHALRRSGFKMCDTIAVFGPGTIGMIICQLAKIGGAKKVLLIGRSQVKLDFAMRYGFADAVCNIKETDVDAWINSMTDNVGVDVAIEGTGASSCLESCLPVTRKFGTVLAMGNPIGDIALKKEAYWKLLRKQLSLVGTWNSSFGVRPDDWSDVIALLEKGLLKLSPLITHRLRLCDLLQGLTLIKDGKEYTNKVMITND